MLSTAVHRCSPVNAFAVRRFLVSNVRYDREYAPFDLGRRGNEVALRERRRTAGAIRIGTTEAPCRADACDSA
jgi:hypothetical protein